MIRNRRSPNEPSRLADEELVLATARGDEAAFEVLYDRHATVAWSLAFRLLGDRETAEDLVQEGFVAVWNGASRYTPSKGSVRTWLLSIIHHRAVDRLRQTDAGRRRQDALEQATLAEPAAADAADLAMGRLLSRQVRQALDDIPDDQRQVLRLAYYGGYTHHEIAQMLTLPLGTVKSRMRLGLERVRANMAVEVRGG